MEEENKTTNVQRSFKVSGMPMSQWLRWEQDCIDNFGDCYWLKIWNDHIRAKDMDILVSQLMKKFDEQDAKIEVICEALNEEQKEEETEEPKTLGRRKEDG